MDTTADSLLTTFDYVWDRLGGRLAGLTDADTSGNRWPGAGRCAAATRAAGSSMAAGAAAPPPIRRR